MSRIAYEKFKGGKSLTRKQAILAQCYECNGFSTQLTDDCLGKSCPLYQWSPWAKSREIRAFQPQKPWLIKKNKEVL